MKKIILIAIALAFSVNARAAEKENLVLTPKPSQAAEKENLVLTPEPARITDEAIAVDMKVMQTVQKKLADLNKKGVPIASYHFAKAQAWLDFALDAYTMNDRSGAADEALRQAVDIIKQLEAGKKDIGMTTPIIPTSALIRPDLWARAEKLKKHANFHCAADKVAQLEVQLVWAGHEEKELGWRHAKPYLQAAERLAREAAAHAAKSCPTPELEIQPAVAKTEAAAKPEAAVAAKPEAAAVRPEETAVKPEPAVVKPEATVLKPEAAVAKPAPIPVPDVPVAK